MYFLLLKSNKSMPIFCIGELVISLLACVFFGLDGLRRVHASQASDRFFKSFRMLGQKKLLDAWATILLQPGCPLCRNETTSDFARGGMTRRSSWKTRRLEEDKERLDWMFLKRATYATFVGSSFPVPSAWIRR